jgi:hypothetical protein
MDRVEPRVRNFGFSRRAWERIQFLVTSNGWPARLAQRFGGASAVHVESHTVRADGPPDAPPLRIAFASDFHAGPTTHPALLRAACDALRAAEPDTRFWFLLGEDAAADLPQWARVDDAFALATFVVVTRPGHTPPSRANLPGDVVHLEVPQLEVSSTQLRARYAEGLATRYLVPPAVDALVKRLGLYGTG